MNKEIAIELLDWALVNVITPFMLPILFTVCAGLFYVKISMYSIFDLLLSDGVYTFLGLTILVSLFQDYRNNPEAFKLYIYITILLSFLINGFIFLSSLNFVPASHAISYSQNINAFVIITMSILTLSIFFKYKILKVKYHKI
jgi:hypothetical protein